MRRARTKEMASFHSHQARTQFLYFMRQPGAKLHAALYDGDLQS